MDYVSPALPPDVEKANVIGNHNVIRDYIVIAKPWMILGNTISAAGGFCLASKGRFDIAAFVSTVAGISLIVASACVFNNCLDRDIDRMMTRTRNRPLARGCMPPEAAVLYGLFLAGAGTALLWKTANTLCTAIALAGFLVYVGCYSMVLKRSSVYATLIGSLAGAAPPLAGYCAVGNSFDPGAVLLGAIFILWQVPHCYSIAIFRSEDYAAAAIPTLPAKLGMPAARKHIIAHILAFEAVALMPTVCGYTGYGYFAAAAALGLFWLGLAFSGGKTPAPRMWAGKLYAFSILNILALSILMSIDAVAR